MELVEEADFYLGDAGGGGHFAAVDRGDRVGTTLQVTGDKLSSAGSEQPSTGKTLYSERRYGGFRRLVNLPGPVRIDEVRAVLVDGVLTITLPKATARARRMCASRSGRRKRPADDVRGKLSAVSVQRSAVSGQRSAVSVSRGRQEEGGRMRDESGPAGLKGKSRRLRRTTDEH